MVDLRVDVVGAAAEHDPVPAGVFQVFERLLAFLTDVLAAPDELCPGVSGGLADFVGRNRREEVNETVGDDLLVGQGEEGIHEIDGGIPQILDVIFNVLRIGGDDRAVVVVDCPLELLALVGDAGVENELHALS